MRQEKSLLLEKEFYSLSQRPGNRMVLLSYGLKAQNVQAGSTMVFFYSSVAVIGEHLWCL